MNKTGFFEIRIFGTVGSMDLKPDLFDIRDVGRLLEVAENLLYPVEKRGRPTISYSVESGSVSHQFRTSLQVIIGLNAVLGQVAIQKNIDFLALNSAKAFETLQAAADEKGYEIRLRTSLPQTHEIQIDKTTTYRRLSSVWVDASFYFYGKVTSAGGKEKSSIRISTVDYGTLNIQTPIDVLAQYEHNMLYKDIGIHASGKQHSETGDLDLSSLKFVEFIDFSPKYDAAYLDGLIEKATGSWAGIDDKQKWLREVRGSYD